MFCSSSVLSSCNISEISLKTTTFSKNVQLVLKVIEHLEKTIFGHNCPLHIHSTVSTPFIAIVINCNKFRKLCSRLYS